MANVDIVISKDEPLFEVESLHLLPVTIQHNGSANVSKMFLIKETIEQFNGKPIVEAAFRGRTFRGVKQSVPEGYQGVIFRENEDQRDIDEEYSYEDDDEEKTNKEKTKTWLVASTFNDFTYWIREENPYATDQIQKWYHWLELSQAIHKPITEEELAEPNKVTVQVNNTGEQTENIETIEEISEVTQHPKPSPIKRRNSTSKSPIKRSNSDTSPKKNTKPSPSRANSDSGIMLKRNRSSSTVQDDDEDYGTPLKKQRTKSNLEEEIEKEKTPIKRRTRSNSNLSMEEEEEKSPLKKQNSKEIETKKSPLKRKNSKGTEDEEKEKSPLKRKNSKAMEVEEKEKEKSPLKRKNSKAMEEEEETEKSPLKRKNSRRIDSEEEKEKSPLKRKNSKEIKEKSPLKRKNSSMSVEDK